MNRLCHLFLLKLSLGVICIVPNTSYAQQYTGDFSKPAEKTKQERYELPIPRIFSTDAVGVKQAEKLDRIYDNLFVSLWNYSSTDFIHQQTLMTLMENEKFRTTRYAQEFTPHMDDALDNLNENYKSMMNDIAYAREQYSEIREGLRMADEKKIEPLWNEKLVAFEKTAKTYFKMQHDFLNTYRNLVGFVLKQGGSYYYKNDTKGVYFYKFGSYHYFGKAIDKLRKISYDQRQFLKANPPANAEVLALR